MLSRNTFEVSFNYAVQDGDEIARASLNQLNVQMVLDFANHTEVTQERFEN